MVRYGSNVKRPKSVIIKQNFPVLSKEAPTSTSTQSSKQKLRNRNTSIYGHHHTPSLSLPSNPHHLPVINEIGLTSTQAIKKLIEEIDRILKEPNTQKMKRTRMSSMLRYFSLISFSIRSLWKLENFTFGIFCAGLLLSELILIEFIEKINVENSVKNSIKEIRNKLRKLDKSLLSNRSDPYALVRTSVTL